MHFEEDIMDEAWGNSPKRRMSADTPCVNNSYSARLWFTITDVNQIT